MVFVGSGVTPNDIINAEATDTDKSVKSRTQNDETRIVSFALRKILATLIKTIKSVIYGDVRSPVRQTSQVIKSASRKNWTRICHLKFLFSRRTKK